MVSHLHLAGTRQRRSRCPAEHRQTAAGELTANLSSRQNHAGGRGKGHFRAGVGEAGGVRLTKSKVKPADEAKDAALCHPSNRSEASSTASTSKMAQRLNPNSTLPFY
jgi:hypothetical protein